MVLLLFSNSEGELRFAALGAYPKQNFEQFKSVKFSGSGLV